MFGHWKLTHGYELPHWVDQELALKRGRQSGTDVGAVSN
jgi:hypothetical protein